MKKNTESQPGGEFLLYQTEDGQTRLETRMAGETVWLSLNQMAALFERDKSVISRHIRNVFEEGELRPEGTVAKFATVQTEGSKSVNGQTAAEVINPRADTRQEQMTRAHIAADVRIGASDFLPRSVAKIDDANSQKEFEGALNAIKQLNESLAA